MKKIYVTLALILCLVICAFAFASCGPEKPASTTAKGTVPATTTGTTDGTCQHVWGEFEVDTPATCTAPGVKSKYCTLCDARDPDSITEIPQLAHTPAGEFTIDKEPTCSEGGSKSKHCTVCGNPVPDTVQPIDPDLTKHNVENWNVTSAVSLFNETGEREGTCTICDREVKEVLTFQPNVQECSDSTRSGEKEYVPAQSSILSVQGDKHFYAIDADPDNDLLMEFSILWNPTMLNLNGTVEGSEGPYCATRIMGGGTTNLTYWSGSDEPKGSWCPYAGGFEGAAVTKGGPAGMGKDHGDYSDYPNIGGSVAADANDLENGHEWGWHRVGVRVHQEVRNLAALMADTEPGATTPTYRTTVTVYFDGEEVFSVYGDNKMKAGQYLYTVASNGDGTVTYTEIAENIMAIPFVLHSRRVKSDTVAYVVTADVSVTCGTEFVQNVERVNAPAGNPTYTIAEGVDVPAKMYFKLAD